MMDNIRMAFAIIVSIVFIGLLLFIVSIGYQNEEMIKCTIEDKWVKRKDKSDMYLVQCDNEVYQITDLIFKGKFNSSDIYANLKVGNTYEITTTGYRFELLSMYKNINKYEKVEDK